MSIQHSTQRATERSLRLPVDWRFGVKAFLWLLALTIASVFLTGVRGF